MAPTAPSRKNDEAIQDDLNVLDRSLILELLPSAALVYSRSSDKILGANQNFFNLTGFTPEALADLQLSALIPGELDTNPTGQQARIIRLMVVSGDLVFANLRVLSMSLTNQVVVLHFSPPDEDQEIRRELLEREFRYDNFSLLTTVGAQTSVNAALRTAAQVIRKVINTPVIAAYRTDQRAGAMIRLDLDEDFNSAQLPAQLDEALQEAISSIHLWKLNKQPTNNLEELTLLKGFQFLAALPLNFNGSRMGMLLTAGNGVPPNDETMRYLALLASHTATTIRHLGSVESASKTLANVRQLVQIERAITDNLEEGVIILTPDLRIAEMSPAAEFMLGYASKEVFQQKADMVLIGNETLSTMYKNAQQGISTLVGNNLSLNHRTGKSFFAQVLCIPVCTNEKVHSIVLILRDLSQTEQIRAHTQQLEQRAFLGEVSAIFAHEVKNPINSISTGLQYMGMTMKPEDPHYSLIERLQNDCARLDHLVKSTLNFSKPVEYHFTSVDLSVMIPSILDRWGPRMTRLNISYNFECNPEHPLVLADARALEQVFVNLISNGIQAMETDGGTLNIKINPADPATTPPQYEVIVADSGPGIPDEMRKSVFEPFMTTKSSGTGLGLAITRRIVSAHKGNIYVESFPGGTMFHILLPMAY